MIWLSLLNNRWVQYGLAAVAILAVLLMVRAHYINEGKQAGQEQAQQQQAATLEDMRKQDRAELQRVLDDAQARMAAADQRAAAASQMAAQQNALVLTLAAQRATAVQSVERVPDSDLHAFNVKQLGLRDPRDTTTTCYTTAEERQIANSLAQYPICQKTSDAQAAELQSLRDQVKAVQDKQDELQVAFNAQAVYSDRLFGYYATLYNLQAPHYRAAHCAFLWRCGKRTLPTPAPAEVAKPAVHL